MNKKLKIYSTLLIVAIVGFALTETFYIHYNYSTSSNKSEELYFEKDGEQYVKNDTLNNETNKSEWQDVLELTFNVRPKNTPGQPTLRSKEPNSIYPDPVKIEMQKVKVKIPYSKSNNIKTYVVLGVVIPFIIMSVVYIWIFCLVVKLIKKIRRGEIFTQQISGYMETSGILMVAAYLLEVATGYFITTAVLSQIKIAYYDIYYVNETNSMLIITGLALMTISQVILMGKELKEEQELTI